MSGTIRQQKYGKLLLRELSEIFQQDKKGILGNLFVSIAEVRVSPDLSVAKVYISMMMEADKKKALDRLNSHKSEIRKALGLRIRNQARIVPELIFLVDEVEENAMKMDALIKSLNIPPDSEASKGKK
ncbi:MAG: 30S ribosome-binding factor RbfA [Bacteroidetes bacterium]|nr:30S ribosome-binding factor RbfA [Bacteroidota bacterium]